MIQASLTSSLSGLNAASLRLGNSANNLANQHTIGAVAPEVGQTAAYVPTSITQSAIRPTGGVDTKLRTLDPAIMPLMDPEHPLADAEGMVAAPNVDAASELMEAKMATYTFKGNLKVMEAQDDMIGSLLDIEV